MKKRKEKQVTRTFEVTDVTFLCINLKNNSVESKTKKFVGEWSDEQMIHDAKHDTAFNGYMVAGISDKRTYTELRAMSEMTYYYHSEVIADRPTKEE